VASLTEAGRYAEAIEPRCVCSTSCGKSWGRMPEIPSQPTNNLALLYMETGDYDQAEPLFIDALAGFEKAEGPDSNAVGTALDNLGELYGYKGDFAKAKSYHERGLANSEKADPGGLLLADGLNTQPRSNSETGHYKEAGPLFDRALRSGQNSWDPTPRRWPRS